MTTLETAKKELLNVNFTQLANEAATEFCSACYDQGLSVAETQTLMYSKQGIETLTKLISKKF